MGGDAYVPVSSCQNRKGGLEENASQLLLKRVGWDGMVAMYVLALVEGKHATGICYGFCGVRLLQPPVTTFRLRLPTCLNFADLLSEDTTLARRCFGEPVSFPPPFFFDRRGVWRFPYHPSLIWLTPLKKFPLQVIW